MDSAEGVLGGIEGSLEERVMTLVMCKKFVPEQVVSKPTEILVSRYMACFNFYGLPYRSVFVAFRQLVFTTLCVLLGSKLVFIIYHRKKVASF